ALVRQSGFFEKPDRGERTRARRPIEFDHCVSPNSDRAVASLLKIDGNHTVKSCRNEGARSFLESGAAGCRFRRIGKDRFVELGEWIFRQPETRRKRGAKGGERPV